MAEAGWGRMQQTFFDQWYAKGPQVTPSGGSPEVPIPSSLYSVWTAAPFCLAFSNGVGGSCSWVEGLQAQLLRLAGSLGSRWWGAGDLWGCLEAAEAFITTPGTWSGSCTKLSKVARNPASPCSLCDAGSWKRQLVLIWRSRKRSLFSKQAELEEIRRRDTNSVHLNRQDLLRSNYTAALCTPAPSLLPLVFGELPGRCSYVQRIEIVWSLRVPKQSHFSAEW